jgi:hypothetical protein
VDSNCPGFDFPPHLWGTPNIVTNVLSCPDDGMMMREKRFIQGFCCGNLRIKDHLGDPGIDGRIILRWIFRM